MEEWLWLVRKEEQGSRGDGPGIKDDLMRDKNQIYLFIHFT